MPATPGRAAIERLGARFEGVRRAHVPATGGGIRDSAYYSIVADEWPAVRAGLESRLAQRLDPET
jgi:RimJ/RimL family protein N-acetyltransferase